TIDLARSDGHMLFRPVRNYAIAVAMALLLWLSTVPTATGQQGSFAPAPPKNQNQRGGVLEVPASPARQGGADSSLASRPAPQQGPELELPSRALRSQSGYEQMTVTVTDQSGRYVTGLQKGDFRLYVNGDQRPLEFLRRDTHTPVSVGILVDT